MFPCESWPNKTEPRRLSSWSLQRKIKRIYFYVKQFPRDGSYFFRYHNYKNSYKNKFIYFHMNLDPIQQSLDAFPLDRFKGKLDNDIYFVKTVAKEFIMFFKVTFIWIEKHVFSTENGVLDQMLIVNYWHFSGYIYMIYNFGYIGYIYTYIHIYHIWYIHTSYISYTYISYTYIMYIIYDISYFWTFTIL